jgi:hypothetical protein
VTGAVLGTVRDADPPSLLRVRLTADPDERRFLISEPGEERLQAGSASLLLHRHDDQLWDLRSYAMTGELSRQAGGWVFSPARFIPGNDGLNPLATSDPPARSRPASAPARCGSPRERPARAAAADRPPRHPHLRRLAEGCSAVIRTTQPHPAGVRRIVLRAGLGGLAAAQGLVGGWAAAAPAQFYAHFPAHARGWVALLPPYNEHLVRDVGTLSLALTVLLAVGAVTCHRLLVRTAVSGFLVYAVPHTAFHGLHLDGFPAGEAIAQMAGFAIQLLLALAAWVATIGPAGPSGGRVGGGAEPTAVGRTASN